MNEAKVKMTNYFPISLEDPSSWKEYKDQGSTTITINHWAALSLPTAFVRALKMEGSGTVQGRMVGFDGSQFIAFTDAFPYGQGATGRPLVPYRSIAVDRSLIPLRTACYIIELKGKTMPDGLIHDGNVTAEDTGGAIKGNHIDFFVRSRLDFLKLSTSLPEEVTIQWGPVKPS